MKFQVNLRPEGPNPLGRGHPGRRIKWREVLASLILLWAAPACRAVARPAAPQTPPSLTSTAVYPATPAPATLSPTPAGSATPTPGLLTPTDPAPPARLSLCSPLDGYTRQDLSQPDLLKNPFAPPRPGYDDGHFGIDLAYWTNAAGQAMQGRPVHAVLAGLVAGVIANREPYGYAVIIETDLAEFSPAVLDTLDLPAPSHTLQPGIGLSCPAYDFTFLDHATSIYTLYAHLDQPPALRVGEAVECGQEIGAVGTTGRSVNAHLHLEMRHGPSGALLSEMAHYDNSASQTEMRNYCLWRISGAFAAFDPLRLFALQN